ncbi:MAG: DUF342 domain-containing protein [Deltaproteobacteria bacterium]|nr:DUF342 domain-containing protein [Deltaproteobacteria bacterium]
MIKYSKFYNFALKKRKKKCNNMQTGPGTNIITKKNHNILGLAVKCRLLTSEQEKQILAKLIVKLEGNPDFSVIQIFRQGYITDENIDFLFSVKKHLELNMLDKRFGELGVANKLIHPENVKLALDLQNQIFKKTHRSKLIGDILLEQNNITLAGKSAILLTQDRVKDELLEKAINDIAATKIEKIAINMRFGAIAVKKRMITITQLNLALKLQKEEERAQKPRRYLGEILKELFGLSDKNLIRILKTQKEFEKKRLSLEKALQSYNFETITNKRLGKIFEYRFSKNKLEAHIRIANDFSEDILIPDLINWLKSIGISFGICHEKALKAFLTHGTIGSEIKVAQGYLPTGPVNESIEFLFDISPDTGIEKTGSKKQTFVKKGDILARITPHKDGKPGKDVCGFQIQPPGHKIIPLGSGKGVVKKGTIFFADIDGTPVLYKNRTLFVTPRDRNYPTKHFAGHITNDFGTKYQSANLIVDGNIDKNGRVVCHKLTVMGDVNGKIRATGEVRIKGNIGCDPGLKDNPAIISSHDNIIADRDIANAVIITSKMLKAPNSDLISSRVYAFQDIFLKNISSRENGPTLLQIGKNPNLTINAINRSIDKQKQDLRLLLHEDEQEKIKNWFNNKIQVQDGYLEQQAILKHLLKLLDDNGIIKFENLDIFKTKELDKFKNELINNTEKMSLKDRKIYFAEMLDIKSAMYRAAVNATQRHKNEYNAQKNFILQKIEKLKPEIIKKKQEIDDLYKKKDFLKLRHAKVVPCFNSSIRVKNKVGKGTVIKGKKSVIALDKSLYCVKFTEQLKKGKNKAEIIIKGLYD